MVAKTAVENFRLGHSTGWKRDDDRSSDDVVEDPVLLVHASVFFLRAPSVISIEVFNSIKHFCRIDSSTSWQRTSSTGAQLTRFLTP